MIASGQAPKPRPPWFFHPLLQLCISVVLSSASQILFKVATNAGDDKHAINPQLFTSWALWGGIVASLTSLVSWLYALRSVPLVIAFNLAAVTYILIPLGSWVFLGEQVPPIRWLGIALVTLGVLVIARPLSHMEERL
jgi:drug/metabolite transporter (DMT)-like permease